MFNLVVLTYQRCIDGGPCCDVLLCIVMMHLHLLAFTWFAESRASCRVAQYGRGGKHGTFAHVCAKYKQYRVNRLEMNSGCSHLTMHLKSPATRQKAIAEEAAAAQAEAMAAAAAHATGATHWYEHMVSRVFHRSALLAQRFVRRNISIS